MRPIKDFPGYYITSCGKVWSDRSNKFLKTKDTNYSRVNLYRDGQAYTVLVHRLVAEAYLPNPNNYKSVDHLDKNHFNNNINNLEWVSQEVNNQRANNKKVRNVETGQVFDSFIAAAESVNKEKSGISACIRGKQKTCGGYHWEVIK